MIYPALLGSFKFMPNCSVCIVFWGSIHKNEYFCVDIVRLPLWSGYICIYNNIFLIAIYFLMGGWGGGMLKFPTCFCVVVSCKQ